MTQSEKAAYNLIKRIKITGPTQLAEQLGVSRQYAHELIKSLKQQGLITYQPARLIAK